MAKYFEPAILAFQKVKNSSIPNKEKFILMRAFDYMMDIPSGSYMRGSPEGSIFGWGAETGRRDNEKQVQCNVENFGLWKYPMTWDLFLAVLSCSEDMKHNDYLKENNIYINNWENPVNCSYEDIKDFCNILNSIGSEFLEDWHFDIPTSTEWEYACRATTTTSLNSGENLIYNSLEDRNLNKVAWSKFNSSDQPHPVGLKMPNKWGLYDMHGNIWECCYEKENENNNDNDNILMRGGSFKSEPRHCRSAINIILKDKVYRYTNVGFRLALKRNKNI